LKTLEAIEDRLDLEEARRIMKKPGRLIPWEKVKSAIAGKSIGSAQNERADASRRVCTTASAQCVDSFYGDLNLFHVSPGQFVAYRNLITT